MNYVKPKNRENQGKSGTLNKGTKRDPEHFCQWSWAQQTCIARTLSRASHRSEPRGGADRRSGPAVEARAAVVQLVSSTAGSEGRRGEQRRAGPTDSVAFVYFETDCF